MTISIDWIMDALAVKLPKASQGKEEEEDYSVTVSDLSGSISDRSDEPEMERPKSRGSHGRVSPTTNHNEDILSHRSSSRHSKTSDSYKDDFTKSHHSTSRRTKTPDAGSYKDDFTAGSLSGSQHSAAASRGSRKSGSARQESIKSASHHSRSKVSHRWVPYVSPFNAKCIPNFLLSEPKADISEYFVGNRMPHHLAMQSEWENHI